MMAPALRGRFECMPLHQRRYRKERPRPLDQRRRGGRLGLGLTGFQDAGRRRRRQHHVHALHIQYLPHRGAHSGILDARRHSAVAGLRKRPQHLAVVGVIDRVLAVHRLGVVPDVQDFAHMTVRRRDNVVPNDGLPLEQAAAGHRGLGGQVQALAFQLAGHQERRRDGAPIDGHLHGIDRRGQHLGLRFGVVGEPLAQFVALGHADHAIPADFRAGAGRQGSATEKAICHIAKRNTDGCFCQRRWFQRSTVDCEGVR